MSQDSNLDMDFDEFRALVEQTTQNLKRLAVAQKDLRWQIGDPEWFTNLVSEIEDARTGWIASNC